MMRFQLTSKVIQTLCGQVSYEKGASFYRTRKVTLTRFDPAKGIFEAAVKGKAGQFAVSIAMDAQNNVAASCDCPSLGSYGRYCQHVAAALLYLQDMPQSESGVLPGEEAELADEVLALFSERPKRASRNRLVWETRSTLEAAFVCFPVTYGDRRTLFGLEMKVGPKKLYTVQDINHFLDRFERSEPCSLSNYFRYEPGLHAFRPEDDAVIRLLAQVRLQDTMYRETSPRTAAGRKIAGGGPTLIVPPVFWSRLLPLLTAAPSVRLEHDDLVYDGIALSADKLPITFSLDRADKEDGYLLAVDGLECVTVLDDYGMALHEGKLLKLQPDEAERLSGLKRMMGNARADFVPISSGRMELFVDKVIPGLTKLGSVVIQPSVADRMTRVPLRAKLYLDRVKDRLLAGLEFHYGDLAINPLEAGSRKRGSDRILLRDGEKERHILELMDQGAFTKTESGYYMTDEEAEYEFLYRVVPQLEKLADIYATSAVKARLFAGHAPPRIVLEADEKTNWLSCRFELEPFSPDEIRRLIGALEDKRKYYRLPNGALMPLEGAELQEMIRFLNEVGIRSRDVTGAEAKIPLVRGLCLMNEQERRSGMRLGKSFRRLLEDMKNPESLDYPVPEQLAGVLRDYQKTGYQWLRTLARYRFGGILADDMGLGKTLQSIAFLLSMLQEIRESETPALVVCPASLLYNWLSELRKFAPDIRAAVADGTKTERARISRNAEGLDVIIVSYPLLVRDLELYAGKTFHTLLLDEAQFFKNHETLTAKAVKAVQAKHRFALTGTPIENRLEELWSIYDAVFPGLFPDRTEFGQLTRESVAKRVRPFLLRRLKTDVLAELPEKIESIHAAELLPEQKKLYMAFLAKLRKESLKFLTRDGDRDTRIKILAGLTRLRQLCCHPALFVEGYAGRSAKLDLLLEIVEECRGAGKRMLVFSQFTGMLELIGRALGEMDVPYFYLDGQTPSAERLELCHRYNAGEREVFLISLKAGGTGLNLTGADTVILYDLWWNPAVEDQAADRAHRFGQKRVVQVIRLMAQGTVEEKMYALQQRKRNLIEEVVQPGQEALSVLTEQDIRELLQHE